MLLMVVFFLLVYICYCHEKHFSLNRLCPSGIIGYSSLKMKNFVGQAAASNFWTPFVTTSFKRSLNRRKVHFCNISTLQHLTSKNYFGFKATRIFFFVY